MLQHYFRISLLGWLILKIPHDIDQHNLTNDTDFLSKKYKNQMIRKLLMATKSSDP